MKRALLAIAMAFSLLSLLSLVSLDLSHGATATKNPYGAPAVDPAGPNEIILTVVANGKSTNGRLIGDEASNPPAQRALCEEAPNFYRHSTHCNFGKIGNHPQSKS